MNKDFEFGYRPNAQIWKDLIDQLKKDGCRIIYFAPTDQNGYFVDFKYLTIEYANRFFYMQEDEWSEGINITRYAKVNPYIKKQGSYPARIKTYGELLNFINRMGKSIEWGLESSNEQRIYLLEFYGLSEGTTTLWKLRNFLAGNREKDILNNLEHIEMIRNDPNYEVLRFFKNDKDWFDYEVKSRRITG